MSDRVEPRAGSLRSRRWPKMSKRARFPSVSFSRASRDLSRVPSMVRAPRRFCRGSGDLLAAPGKATYSLSIQRSAANGNVETAPRIHGLVVQFVIVRSRRVARGFKEEHQGSSKRTHVRERFLLGGHARRRPEVDELRKSQSSVE